MRPFPSRYVNLAEARLRFGDRVDRLGRYLYEVDPAADAVVEALEEMPKGTGWRTFEQGIRAGSRAIPDAPRPMRDLIDACADVPAWVDWATCDRGGELLLRAGGLGGAVLGARSLVLGYASPAGNKPLVFSGRLKEQARTRLDETARFVQAVSRPGGMRPFADGWQITVKVRLIHAQVRRMILKSDRWNSDAWGLPVNQHDMAGTTLLFSVSILDGLRKLGMTIDAEEAEKYIHLWRWVGRVIGVDPGILPASEPDAMRLADLIGATMGDPDQDSRDLTKALFEAAYDGCTTKRQKAEAARKVMFGMAICRELVGDEMADKLGVPRRAVRFVMPMMKRLVAAVGGFTRAVPFAERGAIAAGSRYWDRVVEIGLQGATYEFALPNRLGSLAA
ncbi:MAG: DUF2236 domain-containing protein [Deltaproteobacteria bacterium]|nr:DUF2236 domain-containing protein [Deltaproteobacteria bacterium]